MKRENLITALLVIFLSTSAFAQSNRYHESMINNISLLDTGNTEKSLTMAANNFYRIAFAEKNLWLPYYYAGYALVRSTYAMTEKDKIDAVLDQADRFLAIADSLSPHNSEVITVKANVASARIVVNPMVRGAQYGPISGTLLSEAMKLDPSNPRPYLLSGLGAFYTPEQWGGGKEKAAKLFQTALEKYAAFKPADDLAPNWGKSYTAQMLKQCEQ